MVRHESEGAMGDAETMIQDDEACAAGGESYPLTSPERAASMSLAELGRAYRRCRADLDEIDEARKPIAEEREVLEAMLAQRIEERNERDGTTDKTLTLEGGGKLTLANELGVKITDPDALREHYATTAPAMLTVNAQRLRGIVGEAAKNNEPFPPGVVVSSYKKIRYSKPRG